MKLDNFQYSAATWQKNVLQVTLNTGERYQFFRVPRWLAVLFVRNPQKGLLRGYRFERVRGRVAVWRYNAPSSKCGRELRLG